MESAMVGPLPAFYVANMATDLARKLAENFKAIRRRYGTQEQFAELTGWKQSQVSELENGKRFAYLASVATTLASVGIDPEELLTGPAAEPMPADIQEAAELLQRADDPTRNAVLLLLRGAVGSTKRASG